MLLIGVPIQIRIRSRYPIRPNLNPLRFEDLPAGAADFIEAATNSLQQCGFVRTAIASNQVMSARFFRALLWNPKTDDCAQAVAVYAQPPGTELLRPFGQYVELCTHYSDGTEISTLNSPMIPAVHPLPGRELLWLPETKNAQALYAVHQRRLDDLKRENRQAVSAPEGKDLDWFSDNSRQTMALQAKEGLFYLDSLKEEYRPTWKGALAMAWGTYWPIRWFLMTRAKRKVQAVIGVSGLKVD
jgi:hypothetical protein